MEQKSVAELANWLEQLGEKHKAASRKFTKNVAEEDKGEPEQAPEEQLPCVRTDYKASEISPTRAAPITSPPPTRRSTEGASQFPLPVEKSKPVYRDFVDPMDDLSPCEEWLGPVDEQLRIVSLKKLLDPPLPNQSRNETFVGWNASEDFDVPPTNNAFRSTEPRQYVNTEDCVDETDPFGDSQSRESPHQRAKSRASRLIPLLMCKKTRSKDNSQVNKQKGNKQRNVEECPEFPPPEPVLDFNEWLMSPSSTESPVPIDEVGFSIPVTRVGSPSSHSWCDGSMVLPSTDDNQACNGRMVDIFTDEISKGGIQQLSPVRDRRSINSEVCTKSVGFPRSPGSNTIKTESSSLSSKHSDLKPFTPPRNDISSAIEKFGGRLRSGKTPSVKSRQEQLQKKWAQDRVPSFSKKSKWYPQNGKSGVYKKKVVLDRK